MYSDIHTGIGSAVLTIAAVSITFRRYLVKRFAQRGRHRG
jgi:hypothetical protein